MRASRAERKQELDSLLAMGIEIALASENDELGHLILEWVRKVNMTVRKFVG